jgi:hypothetical protein
MITKFVNRNSELNALNEAYKKPGFQFYPFYGRRRIGKTELIKQFIKDKPHIYFLATEGTEKENILNFKHAAKNTIDLDIIKDDFEELFKYITQQVKKKIIIVIDEFPFLTKTNKATASLFQYIIDEYLSQTNHFLILCGSSVGMMYKEVLGYKAPLYGRRTGQIELHPLKFQDVRTLVNKPIEECIHIYGICGGVPFYLKEFTEKKDFFQLIKEKVLSQEAILNKEAIFLLREELDEISRYASILAAIAVGYTKLGEIMTHCGFKEKLNITPYLHVLERLEMIEKETPITFPRTTRGVYKMKDQFFNFYFQFIRPNESMIESNMNEVITTIKTAYTSYIGKVFEQIAKELIREKHTFSTLGRWWHNGQEIDLVAFNENTKEIAFFECKWKNLRYAQSLTILRELQKKAISVEWHNKKRTERYGLLAKTIERKSDLRKQGFIVYDLEDWK